MDNLLDEQIKILRNNMINAGMTKGLAAKETIQLSKRLDNLMNLKMMLKEQTPPKKNY
ncbi:aspartyl-phosphate phosphatase Spo0E family protein [Niallia taxi]|uniref:aspartyl-phosphate phosphatase Spo0E family protein n=1 Tax=Niallia taxi TaxID=2499688 RepID=UPI003D2C2AEE